MTGHAGDYLPGDAAGAEQGAERIQLSMPADPDLVALARMAASVVGSRIDLTYDEVSDLRLAIDELVVLCGAGLAEGGRVLLEFRTDETGLRIDCSVSGQPTTSAAVDDRVVGLLPAQLSERILDALVDEHGMVEEAGARRGWLWKRRPSL
jgi:hypothetical protein